MKVPPSQAFVIFGASGDLARRKLLPALYNLALKGDLPDGFALLGYARTPWDDDAFRVHARGAVEEFSRTPIDERAWTQFADSLHFHNGSFEETSCFDSLAERLDGLDRRSGTEGGRLFYCATPPSVVPMLVRRLGECGLQDRARIVLEKPFGRDLATARELNGVLHTVFDEPQIFRIDHYLGKETVQNILVLRFFNSMFERVWNRDAIDHVQITVAESGGIEGRVTYYEEAGAVRDIVQNHLLQVLSFVAMEPPRSLEPEAIRDEKVKVLRALRPFDPNDVVYGQYAAGVVEGHEVPGYRGEDGAAPTSETDTFVAVRAQIENWRWADVPFFLRTGKRLARRATEVTVTFRSSPEYLAESAGITPPVPDRLNIRIQPEEGIDFSFQAKEPGEGFVPRTVRMEFAYDAAFGTPAESYERLLHDAMLGDHTLFPREDGVERAWEVVAPALEHGSPYPYAAGTYGPEAADQLIAPREWHLR